MPEASGMSFFVFVIPAKLSALFRVILNRAHSNY